MKNVLNRVACGLAKHRKKKQQKKPSCLEGFVSNHTYPTVHDALAHKDIKLPTLEGDQGFLIALASAVVNGSS